MNKEELKAKMAGLNDKLKELGDKAKDSMDTAIIVGLEAKDKAAAQLEESKSSIAALKENCRIFSDRAKGKASSELLKAQMNIDAAKAELKARKDAKDKENFAKYIEETLEYAESCVVLSALAAEEAKLAKLEAVAAQAEYDAKYGE